MTHRLVNNAATIMSYDAENRLVQVGGATTATFVYNGDGERVQSTVNGTTTAFIGNILEWTGSTTTMKRYYYAGATRVAMRTGSTLSYILGDHLGSSNITTDANGVQTSETMYKPWGEVRYTSGTLPTKYTFTGQYSNVSDFGLMYYNARYYDPLLGRFSSADTLIPEPGNPQSWDRYAYVNNSPVKYTDPSGHQAWDGCSGENGGCAGGSNYKDYVFNYLHTDQERQENQEDLEKAVDTVTTIIGVVNEPADWMMTAAYCVAGECSPWVLVGLLPFVPGSAGRHADEAIALTGQFHHVISNKIMNQLKKHEVLNGVFKRNFVIVQAIDQASHKGYQTWHRTYDAMVVQWLKDNPSENATRFLEYMYILYQDADMSKRFPDATQLIQKMLEELK